MPAKLDVKKKYPKYYNPSKNTPEILEIPPMKYFMIDGLGNPNTAQEYKDAIETLYAISYTLKMKIVKKSSINRDYVVPPLEGLWYMDDMNDFTVANKEKWKWTMMIRIPNHVKEAEIEKSVDLVKELKNPPALHKLRIENYHEGICVQIMYIGPYVEEHETIMKIHNHAQDEGYTLSGHHHEIYLSDPRRIAPEKLKTVLRQPIKK